MVIKRRYQEDEKEEESIGIPLRTMLSFPKYPPHSSIKLDIVSDSTLTYWISNSCILRYLTRVVSGLSDDQIENRLRLMVRKFLCLPGIYLDSLCCLWSCGWLCPVFFFHAEFSGQKGNGARFVTLLRPIPKVCFRFSIGHRLVSCGLLD